MKYTLVLVFLLLVSFELSVNGDCVSDPTPISCENFTLSDAQVQQYNTELCAMMYMVECTVLNLCKDSQKASGLYCDPFSIYKALCLSMPMHGCESFQSMCKTGSNVKQCQTETLAIPGDTTLKQYIVNMCNAMPMPPCSQCGIVTCDSLSVYSALCLSMPSMNQCQDWATLCQKIPNWSICHLPSHSLIQ